MTLSLPRSKSAPTIFRAFWLLTSCLLVSCGGEPDDSGKDDSGKTGGPRIGKPTVGQLKRRDANIKSIKAMGLPTLDSLPVVADDEKVTLREPEAVAKRCLAVAICALKGETEGKDPGLIKKVLAEMGAKSYLSPKESAFQKLMQRYGIKSTQYRDR